MEERNIKLVLAYDGTDFCGWQLQRNGRSVQGVLEAALETMHRHPVSAAAAGRTDSGVHARGQVVSFFSDLRSIPGWKFRDAVNFYLPRDVTVLASSEADKDFHARYCAKQRMYCYYMAAAPVPLPWERRYAALHRAFPDLGKLNRMASLLTGEHDFSAFAAAGDKNLSKKRVVYSSCFYAERQFMVFKIIADSFLYKMVRSLVGTMLELHDRDAPPAAFAAVLEGKKRELAGKTAPANGLFLEKVFYGNEPDYIG